MRIPGESIQDMTEKDYIRFFSQLPSNLDPEICWDWQGTIDNTWRGRFQIKKKKWLASRVSWSILYGDLDSVIPLMHSCDNLHCVNPLHLLPGTNQQNTQDAFSRGQQIYKLTPEAAKFIKESEQSPGKLALLFNVSIHTIQSIRQGKTWNF